GNDPSEDDLGAAGHEPPLDDRLVGAGTDQHGIAPPAHQQLDGLDDQRLARARLPGEGGHPLSQHEGEVGDHAEVAYPQLDQHQLSNRNLVLTMRWKPRGWNDTSRASCGPARQTTASPCSRVARGWPSTTRSAGRPSRSAKRSTSVPPRTSGRLN